MIDGLDEQQPSIQDDKQRSGSPNHICEVCGLLSYYDRLLEWRAVSLAACSGLQLSEPFSSGHPRASHNNQSASDQGHRSSPRRSILGCNAMSRCCDQVVSKADLVLRSAIETETHWKDLAVAR